jgi:putative ABC transport system substrate-binding protein
MRRREFLIALGGAAALPLSVVAQRPVSRTVGVLELGSLEGARRSFGPAQRRLAEMGYVEGRNLALEYRWADNRDDLLTALAGDLVQRRVDAIVVSTGPSIVAAKAATTSIPIIFFTGFDPVASGFVASLNRPGGNVTGISVLNSEVLAKRLQVLCELLPTAKSIGDLYSPANLLSVSGSDRIVKDLETAAQALNVKLLYFEARNSDDLERAFGNMKSAGLDGILVSADALMIQNIEKIAATSARHNIPTVYPIREFAAAGGLVSYGTNYPEAYRQVGDYLGRVLNGEKPENLPVQRVTKVELVINLKTAKALGLTVPSALQARADEVIE